MNTDAQFEDGLRRDGRARIDRPRAAWRCREVRRWWRRREAPAAVWRAPGGREG
jgi:hypothetical protein